MVVTDRIEGCAVASGDTRIFVHSRDRDARFPTKRNPGRAAQTPGAPSAGSILIATAGMGGGHLGAAEQMAIRLRGAGYEVSVFDVLGGMRFGYGRFITAFYRAELHYAMWSYEAIYERWRHHPESLDGANAFNALMARSSLCEVIDQIDPVAVISTYNLGSQVLGHLVERGDVRVPVFTYLTDFGVHPYWLHDAMSGYFTVHESTAANVRDLTDAPVRVTGPFVDPAFRPDPDRRDATRRALGIGHSARVALVVAGAWGVGEIEATVADLQATGAVTPVVVCGHNGRIARRLRAGVVDPGHVFGFVDTMPALMDAADVLVENAGGLTTFEAFVSGLAVVTYRPIPAHGTDNARAMAAAGVTRYAHDRDELTACIHTATSDTVSRAAMIRAGRHVVHDDGIIELLGLVDPRPNVSAQASPVRPAR